MEEGKKYARVEWEFVGSGSVLGAPKPAPERVRLSSFEFEILDPPPSLAARSGLGAAAYMRATPLLSSSKVIDKADTLMTHMMVDYVAMQEGNILSKDIGCVQGGGFIYAAVKERTGQDDSSHATSTTRLKIGDVFFNYKVSSDRIPSIGVDEAYIYSLLACMNRMRSVSQPRREPRVSSTTRPLRFLAGALR